MEVFLYLNHLTERNIPWMKKIVLTVNTMTYSGYARMPQAHIIIKKCVPTIPVMNFMLLKKKPLDIWKENNVKDFIEKIKFKIAYRLDKNPEYCWANLVMWALNYRPWWSIFCKTSSWNDYKERGCDKQNGFYCGKCDPELNKKNCLTFEKLWVILIHMTRIEISKTTEPMLTPSAIRVGVCGSVIFEVWIKNDWI